MTNNEKQVVRVVGHIISAATWAWALLQALITGNWKGFAEKAFLGIAGHVVTEALIA